MPDDNTTLREALWNAHQEHCTQARHHENLRTYFGAALIAVAGTVIGAVTFTKTILPSDLPLTAFVVVIGAFGALFSAKHHERERLHMELARRLREAFDRALPGTPLKQLKFEADSKHNLAFPILHSLHFHNYWTALYLVIAGFGLVLSFIAVFVRQQVL